MSRITTCPRCSTRISVPEGITDKTLICLRCLAEVNNPWPGSQVRAADLNTDVKRDVNAGGIILVVLMGLCVLGIAMARNPERPLGEQILLLFSSCVGLLVLVCIAIVRWLVRQGNSGTRIPNVENTPAPEDRTEEPASGTQAPNVENVYRGESSGTRIPSAEYVLAPVVRMEKPATGTPVPKVESVFGCFLIVMGTIVAIYIFMVLSCWNYKVVSH